MMCCEEIERQLGRYTDNELPEVEREEVDVHLQSCSSCRAGLAELRDLAAGLAAPASLHVPGSVWQGIERRLDETPVAVLPPRRVPHRRPRSIPWAIAAGLVIVVGLGMFGLSSLDTTARASTVDFGVLLDALPLDAQKAFRKFLVRYDAKPTTPVAAKRIASHLNFETPAVLPGGFRLQSVYQLRIGGTTGIAASYDREGEFLAAVFHPPMRHEEFGSHENLPCVIGEHCGHKVEVGEWKLVHLTDPTTCHCLLSRLDEEGDMPAVMRAIAPKLPDGANGRVHVH